MALKLRIISDHYKALGKRSSRLFGVTGGRIGRSQDNDWILPDPDRYISSHHCKVEFRAGTWVLEDTSTNGVFINGSDVPASVDGAYDLKDGDRLRLGDYEILVSIDERNDFSSDASGQMRAPARASSRREPKVVEDLGEELDLTDLLSDAAIQSKEPARPTTPPGPFDLGKALGIDLQPTRPGTSSGTSHGLANTAPGKPPRSGFASLLDNPPDEGEQRTVTHSSNPQDWQMQTQPYDRKSLQALTNPGSLARPPEKPAPQVERPRRAADNNTLEPSANGAEAFCRGAGIDPETLPADAQNALLQLAGQMMREVVLGLMDVLKGRADQKNRLRLSQTTIQPGENNPLKFSASVDEALLRLLDPHNSRYLGPVEAIRDSFADLRTHQVALSTAIQAAIDEVMNRIEPGELQERFDRGLKRGALLGAANKMKYWDLYTEFYHVLNQRNEQNLPTLFAEEMARTYAEKAALKKR